MLEINAVLYIGTLALLVGVLVGLAIAGFALARSNAREDNCYRAMLKRVEDVDSWVCGELPFLYPVLQYVSTGDTLPTGKARTLIKMREVLRVRILQYVATESARGRAVIEGSITHKEAL